MIKAFWYRIVGLVCVCQIYKCNSEDCRLVQACKFNKFVK